MSSRSAPQARARDKSGKWWVDENQCVGCAICVDVCSEGALIMGRDDLVPVYLAERCTACGQCAEQCPTGAIVVTAARAE